MILYYNAMIRPLFNYASIVWQSSCTKESLLRILRLQKRAARVILNAESKAHSVTLFNKLEWLPFYMETYINMCTVLYKRCHCSVPEYLMDTLKLNSSSHTRNTRFCDLNYVTPRYLRKSEGGRTFLVNAISLWNNLPPFLKKQSLVKSFKIALFSKYFNEQLCIKHLCP